MVGIPKTLSRPADLSKGRLVESMSRDKVISQICLLSTSCVQGALSVGGVFLPPVAPTRREDGSSSSSLPFSIFIFSPCLLAVRPCRLILLSSVSEGILPFLILAQRRCFPNESDANGSGRQSFELAVRTSRLLAGTGPFPAFASRLVDAHSMMHFLGACRDGDDVCCSHDVGLEREKSRRIIYIPTQYPIT